MHSQAEAIWAAVAPALPGFSVEILPEIDSSNTELMRRARAGQSDPVLLVAERQTAGRGRLGRQWQSQPGDSLTFSLGLALEPSSWSGFSLAVGVSLAESLHPAVRLKWPNDLWVDDRKLGGILVETASFAGAEGARRYAVVGVGLNIRPREAADLSTAPAWLQQLDPGLEAPTALRKVAARLVTDVLLFERDGFAAFRSRFLARDALQGRGVVLSDGMAGTAAGVAEDGALLVHTARGIEAISSSEVSVRPRP